MPRHFIFTLPSEDTKSLTKDLDSPPVVLYETSSGPCTSLGSNVWEVLDRHGLTPQPIAVDFCRLAIAAYSADQRIDRRVHGFDGWTREICLHLPVTELEAWGRVRTEAEAWLSFITGDKWSLVLRRAPLARPAVRRQLFKRATRLPAECVSLFSGGLDSFVGAIDALARGSTVYFVSHYGGGSGRQIRKTQSSLIRALERRFGVDRIRHCQYFVEAPRSLTGEREASSRARSVLFLGLAVLTSSALEGCVDLVVPENGFISINAPLSLSRVGAHSTRTTHPHTLGLASDLLRQLGLEVSIRNPYASSTKGEILVGCLDRTFLDSEITTTMSCAHPENARFRGKRGTSYCHCGYCFPCLVRRAAMHKAGSGIREDFLFDVLRRPPTTEAERSHIFAIETAILRARRPGQLLPLILSTGPLASSTESIDAYINVYQRGLNELEAFLKRRKR